MGKFGRGNVEEVGVDFGVVLAEARGGRVLRDGRVGQAEWEASVGEAARVGVHQVNEVAAVAEVRVFECLVRLHDGRAGQALALSGGEYLQAGVVVEP